MQLLNDYGIDTLDSETQQYLNNIMQNMEINRSSTMEMRKLKSKGLSSYSTAKLNSLGSAS